MTAAGDGTGVDIREATALDAALFAALHAASFETPGTAHQTGAWNETAMAQFIAGPSTLCLFATLGGKNTAPAGLLVARAAGDEADLITIGVNPKMRQRGVGRALLQHAVSALKAVGVRLLFLEVDEENQPALALYRGLGAEAVGSRPRYYENGGNAALLRLDLQSCPLGSATR
ncbi:MAG: GNAT family N-acetyltransferase [Methyloceanibacter sp.]|nr:GNAT family N-acetyltransferase [Methyloceanibacter sp.]